ncbi:hypothetical protein E4U54_001881, partial [Claviceps lovelessii]
MKIPHLLFIPGPGPRASLSAELVSGKVGFQPQVAGPSASRPWMVSVRNLPAGGKGAAGPIRYYPSTYIRSVVENTMHVSEESKNSILLETWA